MTELAGHGFLQAEGLQDWRVLDGSAQAWFAAPSHAAGAALLDRVADLAPDGVLPITDLRAGGVRIRLDQRVCNADDAEPARRISAAAQDLGLAAYPLALQTIRAVIATPDAAVTVPFWQRVLNYRTDGDGLLADPLHRDPAFSFRPLAAPRPPRNRIHVDVVRPGGAVDEVRTALGIQPSGPYGVMLPDADGNEVDLVPGDQLPTAADTADWWAVFAGMALYRSDSASQARHLAVAAAELADTAGVPLLIDVRPNGVILDSGKDEWESDGGPRPAFLDLAGRIGSAAADLGLTADPGALRFVQFGIDAVDVPASRAFWAAALGYRPDPRPQVTDIYDPRRLNPVLFFQPMQAGPERLRQPDRIHLELLVPPELLADRVAAAVAAGGHLLERNHDRCRITDPSGIRLDIVAG